MTSRAAMPLLPPPPPSPAATAEHPTPTLSRTLPRHPRNPCDVDQVDALASPCSQPCDLGRDEARLQRPCGCAVPAELPGPSLYALQRWANERGYDTYLLGSTPQQPILIGVTGSLWRDEYEVVS